MSFEPQNDLERSLVKAANDPLHRPQFYKDFARADIFIIVPHGGLLRQQSLSFDHAGPDNLSIQQGQPPPEEEHFVLSMGDRIKIKHIEHNGGSYIPIFSSKARLQEFITENERYLCANAVDLLQTIKGAALFLNPGSDYGKEITEDEAARIADGSIGQPIERWVAQKETKVCIGQPENYPSELATALQRFFKSKKQVKRAWLAHFFDPERDQAPHTLIAIEASGNFDAISAEAGIIATSIKIPDPPIDIMRFTGRGGVEAYLKTTKPFYKRRFFGLF